jgi:secreted trypsin-like serine protease
MVTLKKICGASVAIVGFILAAASNAGEAPTDVELEASTLLTTRGDPAGFIVLPGTGYDGVADIIIKTPSGFIRGSGVLIQGGGARYVLTAAHVVDQMVSMGASSVFFDMPAPVGRTRVGIAAVYIQPDWDGRYLYGNDLAIIELAAPAPAGAEEYPIYRGSAEVGAVGTKLGYGRSGTGDQGDVIHSGTKRMGENKYDALAGIFGDIFVDNGYDRPLAGAQLAYDFDNGSDANDAFGVFLGIHDLGVDREVLAAPGDSGGPTFINGQVAGITSYGMRMAYTDLLADPLGTSDIDGVLNSSYGEFAVDSRVAYYAPWVDSVVPEPMTVTAMLLGLAGLVARYRYLRKR